MHYDVVVAGGSISGLLCAREVARGGHSVLVLEKDHEIGTPEHCGGMVSLDALEELGIVPSIRTFGGAVELAEIFAPNGKSFTIRANRQRVIEVSRRELDKQIARQACAAGAIIRTSTSVRRLGSGRVRTAEGDIEAKVTVDARGVSSLIRSAGSSGALSCAQYEVKAPWIERRVEVYLDQTKYPGFFAWVIPSPYGTAKIGVAGRWINATVALDEFLAGRGEYSILRRIMAPLWVGGPLKSFVSDSVVTVGDAAGQTKPTTAGGIYSCGMGGILAGRTVSRFLDTGDRRELSCYRREWANKFGKEFKRQLDARRLLEGLENDAINRLFECVTPKIVQEISELDGFDFHAVSIARLLGARMAVRATRAVIESGVRRLLS